MDAARREGFRSIDALAWLFEAPRFPAFALCLVLFYKALLVTILLWPAGPGPLGAFAEDFKTWCFGYDPATGHMQPMYVVSMLVEPLVVGGGVLLLWGRPLVRLLARPSRLLPAAAMAVVCVAVFGASFGFLRSPAPRDTELPFPAEALRIAHTPPAIQLRNQDGIEVSLAGLRGRVVLVTGVYASCGLTCPMILGQAKRAIGRLPAEEQREVTVVAITLDPEHDDAARRAAMAAGQGVRAPAFNFLGGDPATVNRLLDDLEIRRERNAQTGAIDHANLFILVDRAGRIAYRFSLGERQERWLEKALHLLAAEARA